MAISSALSPGTSFGLKTLRATGVALDVDRVHARVICCDGADGVKSEVVYEVCPAHDKLGPDRSLDRDGDVETIS